MNDIITVVCVLAAIGLPTAILYLFLSLLWTTNRLKHRITKLEADLGVIEVALHQARLQAPEPGSEASAAPIPVSTTRAPELAPDLAAGPISDAAADPLSADASVDAPDPPSIDAAASAPPEEPAEHPDGPPVDAAASAPPGDPALLPPWRVAPERLFTWIAAGLGGGTIILAILLVLALAIERGLLGPAMRVSGGLVGGSLLWGAGIALRRRIPVVGASLSGVAIGALYGSLYAASSLYALISSNTAFFAMIALTVVASATATRDGDRFTAHIGLLGGILTPVLISSGSNRSIALFTYLALLVTGNLLSARKHRWWDLVLATLLGAGGLYVGWSSRWHQVDQVVVALSAAVVLALPFAWTARSDDRGLRTAGVLGTTFFALAALPWLMPIDPVLIDPFSGLIAYRSPGRVALWVVLGASLTTLPTWWAIRTRPRMASWGTIGLLSAAVLLVSSTRWTLLAPDNPGAAAALATLPVFSAFLIVGRSGRWANALIPVVLASGAALGYLAAEQNLDAAPIVGVASAALALLGLAGARQRGAEPMMGAALLSAAAAMLAATWSPDLPDPRLLGPALFILAAMGVAPLTWKWERPVIPLITAALAWPAMWPPLHALWLGSLGDSLVGALPLLLGCGALLGAVAARKIHGVSPDSTTLASFAAVGTLGAVAAVPLQLHTGWLTVVWALQAVGLAALARRFSPPIIRYSAAILALTVAARLLLNPFAFKYGGGTGLIFFNWILYTWGIPFLALLAVAYLLPPDKVLDRLRPVLVLAALGVGFGMLNLQVNHAFFVVIPPQVGGALLIGMVRSLTWAGYGIAILLTGLFLDQRMLRVVGFIFLLLATGRVFLVDLWALSGLVRVISVGGLGVCLLFAAFLFERLVLRSPSSPESSE